MLKTGDGIIGSEEVYDDECGFVTYVINPWRGSANPSRYLGWMIFTITYTFSGMKRPGATLSMPQEDGTKRTARKDTPKPQVHLSDWEIEDLHK